MLFACCTHGTYDGFCETVIYIMQQPLDLSQETIWSDAVTEQNSVRSEGHISYASLRTKLIKYCRKEQKYCLYTIVTIRSRLD